MVLLSLALEIVAFFSMMWPVAGLSQGSPNSAMLGAAFKHFKVTLDNAFCHVDCSHASHIVN